MDGQDDSSARGLKALISKRRRIKEEPTIVEGTATRLQEPGNTKGEALKSRPSSNDGKEGEREEKLLSLIPRHSRRKEKRRRGQQIQENGLEPPRGRSSDSHGRDIDESTSTGTNGDESSFMTSDSDREDSTSRPLLIDRESHTGYLTSTSPQIRATTVNSFIAERNARSPTGSTRSFPKVAALPHSGSATANNNNLATQHDFTSTQVSGASSLSIDSEGSGKSSRSRGASPGSKIKDAFKPSRRGTTPVSPTNGDRPGSSSSLGGLFNKDRSAVPPPKSPKFPDKMASQDTFHKKTKSATQSIKSIPSIVTTPETPPPLPNSSSGPEMAVTPPTPVGSQRPNLANQDNQITGTGSSNPNLVVSSSGNMISHRRARSETAGSQPSKLSQSMAPPATPTIEEIKTPGVKTSTQSSGGFFTSMFSAAQNAASTITNIGNNSPGRARSTTAVSGASGTSAEEGSISRSQGVDGHSEPTQESTKPLAIDTIGSGELNFSHLGISNEPPSAIANSPSQKETPGDRSRSSTVVRREEASARAEDESAARAVSAAYSQLPEDPVTTLVEDALPAPTAISQRASSVYEGSITAEKTPPTSVHEGETGGLLRSGSLRNKVEKAKRRRHRNNSSSATIGAAISATNSAVMGGTNASNPKMTGFAVATKKRNRDFHQLFRSVPEDDYLIEDYNCALQRDILLAGRIYISEGHICFSSNILGWITTLVISFDEIVCIEKEITAMVFPNAIAIQTLHARHTFRSLINRDTTYDLMIKIWKISHPGLQSSENGVNVTSGTGSKTEKIESPGSDLDSAGSDDGEIYDEDDDSGNEQDDDDDDGDDGDDDSEAGTAAGSIRESLAPESPPKLQRKSSNIGNAVGQSAGQAPTVDGAKAAERAAGVAAVSSDFAGPATHAPTECSDSATHYEKILKDETIPAPLGKVYSMVFGATSGGFMSRWLVDDQKCTDLQLDESKALGEECKTRSYSYIKPLGGSIGPKQTKCIISEQLDSFDLEKAVTVTITTQTPDVPSGNVFSVKTRYCLMWGPNNGTRMIMCCAIEWTGKSWLKGPIEKGANDGQVQYANDFFKALRSGVSSKPKATGGKAKKGGKKKRSGDTPKSLTDALPAQTTKANWGPLEPLHDILEPVANIISPVVNVYTMGFLLVVLIVIYWRSPRANAGGMLGQPGFTPHALSGAQRKAAYEQIWRSEEDALWDWLENRIGGAEGIVVPGTGPSERERSNADQSKMARKARQQVLRGEGSGLSEKEVKRAIEVTEQRLQALKEAVGGMRMDGSSEDL